ncbi:MAG: sel1 repeat family protein, partial [Geminicoccaceae bacterium]|nr:sel1 repeat family protein [Geminicoccaceae bacterium]
MLRCRLVRRWAWRCAAVAVLFCGPERTPAQEAGGELKLCGSLLAVAAFDAAFEPCRKAAEAGHPLAMTALGMIYSWGWGVRADHGLGIQWWRKAADAGETNAMVFLGQNYANGDGVAQDYRQALYWYQKAAEAGHAGAMNNLGSMYESGRGVRRDLVRAHMWYNLAAARESGKVSRAIFAQDRDRVAARLSSAEIARAQRLARDWRPRPATAPPPATSPPEPAPPAVEPGPA